MRNLKAMLEKKQEEINRKRESEEKALVEYDLILKKFVTNNPKPKSKLCIHGVVVYDYGIREGDTGFMWEEFLSQCEKCDSEVDRIDRINDLSTSHQIPQRYVSTPTTSRFLGIYKAKGGVVFSGGVGTGKTYEAITLVKNIYIEDGTDFTIHTCADLAIKLKSAIKEGTYSTELESLTECSLLLIDDIGAENATPFLIESLYVILNTRYNEMLPIILTTNLSAEEFSKIYGQRIISRLTEMAEFVILTGVDKRINKTKK